MGNPKNDNDESVSWQANDLTIPASLTHPSGDGPFPAVIMVAGSGPTDRNWNSPLIPGTNGSAALLARVITEAGFITLRYDKTGSGPQAKENAMRLAGRLSLKSYRAELAGGMQFLAARPDVIPSRIYVLGNSEGCLHALYYQANPADMPFAGLILTAPMARPTGVLARSQISVQLAGIPGSEGWLASYDAAMADFVSGREVKVAESLPEGIRNLILSVTYPANQPFARELWTSDPIPLISRISAPVLIVIGKRDIQVDWQADGDIYQAYAKDHKNITIRFPENADHVLKYEPQGGPKLTAAEAMAVYGAADAVLDPLTVEIIITWLRSQN
jgi:uncharacterized protein